jgi:hypothetical protein
MDPSWFAPIDSYCERTDAGFWSEPLNAVSNGAFLVAAAWALAVWRRAGSNDRPALWLIGATTIVGIGSFLFHTFANRWSLLADVLPIALFIYSYFFVAIRRYLALGFVAALGALAIFILVNIRFEALWRTAWPDVSLNGSVGYLPAALAMIGVGGLARLRAQRAGSDQLRDVSRALLAASAVFVLSLTFRSLDLALCPTWPLGTHVVWHALNAFVLFLLMRAAILYRVPR